jgi:hypothetical protein
MRDSLLEDIREQISMHSALGISLNLMNECTSAAMFSRRQLN